MGRGETVRFADVVAVKGSGKAVLCRIDGAEHWIPQSQIDDESEVWKEGDEGMLVVTEWIATQKGLL